MRKDFFNSKKGIEWNKLVGILLVTIVLILVIFRTVGNEGIIKQTSGGIDLINTGSEKMTEDLKQLFETDRGELEEENKIDEDTKNTIIKSQGSNIESFGSVENIDPLKLKAILILESSGKPFMGDHPTVRFECVRFNKKVSSSQKVPCDTSKYEYGSAADTGKTAFLKALEINREQAILQTSFGLGQIMGFNYKNVGFNSPEEFYQAMFSEDEQTKAFLNFIVSDSIIRKELEKTDTNWAVVARKYNGDDYKTNNYDVKLGQTYNRLKEASA